MKDKNIKNAFNNKSIDNNLFFRENPVIENKINNRNRKQNYSKIKTNFKQKIHSIIFITI